MICVKNGEETEVTQDNPIVVGPAQVVTRPVNKEITFKKDEKIKFSNKDFSDICFTCFTWADRYDLEVQNYGISQGINKKAKDE